ncbi:MAG: UDP-glucose--hexose-1-phosphate uridylyltransferase, partial [Culicoidibacterales bacterium]
MDAHLSRLIAFAQQKNLIEPEDTIYAMNQLLGLLQLNDFHAVETSATTAENPAHLLAPIMAYAVQAGLVEDTITERDLFDTKLMNALMPRPSQVIREFNSHYAQHPQQATTYYYNLSKASNYIRTNRTDKNVIWQTNTPCGVLDMTINLSKPEKDPRDIAKEKHLKATNYPKCLLCIENEGSFGNIKQPARNNHRIIPLTLVNENWFLQYSPYVYYNEHCIILKATHEPMKLQRATFERLLAFVEQFPHYFIGSNADLPIVGGSILSHDHFQGGRHTFAMEQAPMVQVETLAMNPNVSIGQV